MQRAGGLRTPGGIYCKNGSSHSHTKGRHGCRHAVPSLSKKWLAPLFRGFHSSLAPTARPGSYAGKPLLRKAFCGFDAHVAKSDYSLRGLRPPSPQGFLDKLKKRPQGRFFPAIGHIHPFPYAFFLKSLLRNKITSITANSKVTRPRVIQDMVRLWATTPMSNSMGNPNTMAHRF